MESIEPCSLSELRAACWALFASLPTLEREARSARAVALFESGEFDIDGLLVARVGSELRGAMLYQRHPGNAALVWPPGVVNGDESLADRLVAAVVKRMRESGVKQAQCLLPPSEHHRADPLLRGGFHHVTQLVSFCRPVAGRDAELTTSPLTFAPAVAETPGFAEVLLRSYDGTLDCPELNGTRGADEILEGNTLPSDAPVWFLANVGSEPVGLVMFTTAPRDGMMELSYLGLTPEFRRRGYGAALVRFVLRTAAERRAEWLTLSADVRNEPALKLYKTWDFREYDRQEVFLWTNGEAVRPREDVTAP